MELLVEPEEKVRFPIAWLEYGVVAVLTAGVFLVGLYPQPLFDGVENATSFVFAVSQGAAVAGVGP